MALHQPTATRTGLNDVEENTFLPARYNAERGEKAVFLRFNHSDIGFGNLGNRPSRVA
jgi:hypothetical protein